MMKKRKITLEEYNKAIEEYNRTAGKRFRAIFLQFGLLAVLLFACIIALITFADMDADTDRLASMKQAAPGILVPCIVFLVLFTSALAFCNHMINTRCPKCRRYFPNGELVKYMSHRGTDIGITGDSDTYYRSSATHVYWTECRYCGHLLWVVK